ncbi:hypothetical protein D9M73_168710 [compost metagenome]
MGLEGAGNRHLHREFAQADHHQVHQQAGDQICEHGADRAALVDDHAGAHEQPGADDAAQGQHEDVPALESAGQLYAFLMGAAISVFVHVGTSAVREVRSARQDVTAQGGISFTAIHYYYLQ